MIHNTVKRRRPLIHQRIGDVERVTICGRTFLMDAEDFHLLEGWSIAVLTNGYVKLQGTAVEKPIYQTALSRLIMRAPAGMDVDHISGNPLDNRKVNLRVCTHAENQRNHKKHADGHCPYKGCYYMQKQRGTKKWTAQLYFKGVVHSLGCHVTAEDAARAYNAKAIELHGQYARVNVIGCPGKTEAVVSIQCGGVK